VNNRSVDAVETAANPGERGTATGATC
jgi:hypothetical protein